MIIWLASYPRSGNTLLRTILKRCFDLDSYADEPIHVESPLRSDSSWIGHRELPCPWPEFYENATRSPDRFLVKTHLPPVDEQPYIYIVRDGRSAVQSYRKYYASYLPGHDANLYRLIAGDDAYGDWTSHHDRWVLRGQGVRGMTMRFEDLGNIDAGLLGALARFVGHGGDVIQWTNPLENLSRVEPGLFGSGRTAFEADSEWTPLVNDLFNLLHAPLLERLGYRVLRDGPLAGDRAVLFDWVLDLVRRNKELGGVCDERLALIHRLSDEAQRRLELIHALSPKEHG